MVKDKLPQNFESNIQEKLILAIEAEESTEMIEKLEIQIIQSESAVNKIQIKKLKEIHYYEEENKPLSTSNETSFRM